MKLKINSNGIVYLVFWLWVFSNCFTLIDSEWFLKLDGTYSSMHIHNILALFLILLTLGRKRLKIPKGYFYVLVFFIEITLIWAVNAYKYGISTGYISTIYGVIIMICVAALSDCFDRRMINRLFESVALVVAFLIVGNLLIHIRDVVGSLRAGWAHPHIVVFFGGGVNLEATWMTMFGVFFRKKWKYRYWLFSSLLSVIYLSRTGVVVNLLLLLIYMYQDNRQHLFKRIFILAVLFVATVFVSYRIGLLDDILKRFMNIGGEAGSRARMIIWRATWRGSLDKPLGVGCGNTMAFLRDAYNLYRSEGNAHNIYLQCLLENNIVGFSLLLVGIIKLGIKQMKNRFSDPCGVYLLLYAFQGLFQMQMKEPFMFLILALYFILSDREGIETSVSV